MDKKITLEWVKPLKCSARHSAFTDLLSYKNQLFCCFRQAETHISADGKIKIQTLDGQGQIKYQQQLALRDVDLRDPKLSVTPDGKMLLIAYARHINAEGNTHYGQPCCWFSSDGKSWSSPRYFAEKNWWLWRVTWHKGTAYGFAYNRGQQKIKLYAGDPRRAFHCIQDEALSFDKHGLGYPNESHILFDQNNVARALIRRDADSCTAQLGIAKPPYTRWQWHDLGEYIGGPAMLALNKESYLAGGRYWAGHIPKMALFELNHQRKTMKPFAILPSAGDSSYPGMQKVGKDIYISYYSSHIDGRSQIFLAKLGIESA